jgi:hypothetical protein
MAITETWYNISAKKKAASVLFNAWRVYSLVQPPHRPPPL